MDIVEVAEIVAQESSNILDTLSEPSDSSSTRDDQNGDMSEVCEEKRQSECLKHVIFVVDFSAHASCFSCICNILSLTSNNLPFPCPGYA